MVDVAHLDAVVSRFCLLADTATAIILKAPREHRAMLPPQRSGDAVQPPPVADSLKD